MPSLGGSHAVEGMEVFLQCPALHPGARADFTQAQRPVRVLVGKVMTGFRQVHKESIASRIQGFMRSIIESGGQEVMDGVQEPGGNAGGFRAPESYRLIQAVTR